MNVHSKFILSPPSGPPIATIEQFCEWVAAAFRKPNIHVINYALVPGDASKVLESVRLRIYTENNSYQILAISSPDKNYLQCSAQSRRQRAGETWNRGSDLVDGRLSFDTWCGILAAIASYESVRVHDQKADANQIRDMLFGVHPGEISDNRITGDVSQGIQTNERSV